MFGCCQHLSHTLVIVVGPYNKYYLLTTPLPLTHMMTSSFGVQARQYALDDNKMEFIHEKLIETGGVAELTTFFDAAVLCVSENPSMRPAMGQVVRLIEGTLQPDGLFADTIRGIDTVIEIAGSESGFEEIPILRASPHNVSNTESPENGEEGEALVHVHEVEVDIDSGEFGRRHGKEDVLTVDTEW